MHGWYRFAATIVLGFHGIARISEVLRANRGDLVLPSDQFSSYLCSAFLKVLNPKTKRRGKGKVQHLRLSEPTSVAFLEKIFGPLHSGLSLYPFSSSSFRSRWNLLMDELAIPSSQRPTPASIRGGGAIYAYQLGEPIQNIMWRMRVAKLAAPPDDPETLEPKSSPSIQSSTSITRRGRRATTLTMAAAASAATAFRRTSQAGTAAHDLEVGAEFGDVHHYMWDAVEHLDKGLQVIVCKVIAEKLQCFKTQKEAGTVL
eukprot:Skav216357  [mRNA]  locus=scaffold3700:118:7863:+ [translate_table: standard]